ncbi:MAG: hypothetical protein CL609_20695 [Anaerolineaceae bacterium]|nr:hypothetical protein [Anaerolineaceae bacterium]
MGENPDYRGLKWVEENKEYFGPTPQTRDIYVAAGMAIQSQWMSIWDQHLVDTVLKNTIDAYLRCVIITINGKRREWTRGVSPAQMDDNEYNELFNPIQRRLYKIFGYDQITPRIAIKAMEKRIYGQINFCHNCKPGDKFIIAAIAQNSQEINYEKDLNLYLNFEEKEYSNLFNYAWREIFNSRNPKVGLYGIREKGHNNYDTRFMLALFTNDIRELIKSGWLLPFGIESSDLTIFEEYSIGEPIRNEK